MSGQVVIDLEAVGYPDLEALASKVDDGHRYCDRSACCFRMVADAIRSQDRPAEPQLLAALARDADDLLWIKVDRGSHPWRSAEPEPRKARWSDLAEPEVLLPGWDAAVTT